MKKAFFCIAFFCIIGLVFYLILNSSTEQAVSETLGNNSPRLIRYESAGTSGQITWESEESLNALIEQIKDQGGKLFFSPGTYTIRSGIKITNANNLELYGNGATLRFPAEQLPEISITRDVKEGDTIFSVTNSSLLEVGSSYQLYASNKKGSRLLEFTIAEISGDKITITKPVRFMAHVKSILAGSLIYEEFNFFRITESNNIQISDFIIDGLGLGEVKGHTIYSGILAENNYHAVRDTKTVTYHGLHIQDCTFQNLQGRAVVVYGTDEVLIEDCLADNIQAEAIELDHFSSGIVRNNKISRAGVGIQLDDAFKSTVEHNEISNTKIGISLVSHFDDTWVDTGNTVSENQIGFTKQGIFFDEGVTNNYILGNVFSRNTDALVGEFAANILADNIFPENA